MAAIIKCDVDGCDGEGQFVVSILAHHPGDKSTIWPVGSLDACAPDHACELARGLLGVDPLSFQRMCNQKGGERAQKLPVDKWRIHEVSIRPHKVKDDAEDTLSWVRGV